LDFVWVNCVLFSMTIEIGTSPIILRDMSDLDGIFLSCITRVISIGLLMDNYARFSGMKIRITMSKYDLLITQETL
jgi:hypothetical protein